MKKFFIDQRKHVDRKIKETYEELRKYFNTTFDNHSFDEKEEYLYVTICEMCKDHYDYTLQHWKYYDRNFPDYLSFMYNKDGHTLSARIIRWLKEYNKKRNKAILFYRVCLIAKHQGHYLDAEMNLKLVRETRAYQYVTIGEGGADGTCEEECMDNHGTYDVREIFELPPYHPDCNCVYWFHEKSDPMEEPDDESWMPMQDGWLPYDGGDSGPHAEGRHAGDKS